MPNDPFSEEPTGKHRKFVSRKQPAYTSHEGQTDKESAPKQQDHADVDLKAASDAFDAIRKLVNECPEEYLIELFKKHTGSDFIPDFAAVDLAGSLSSLEQMAALGHTGAVENLAAIANRIAGFLDRLAGSPNDKIQKHVDDGKLTHRELDKHRSWKQDYRELSKALRVLVKVPAEELRKLIEIIDEKYPSGCLLPEAFGMFTRGLHRLVLSQSDDQSASDSLREPSREVANLEELDSLFAKLLEHRAQHLAREATRQVIAKAETWPIRVPALVDGRSDRIEKRLLEIGLGSGLGYDLAGTPSGRPREILSNHNTGNAYRIFLKLNRERKAGLKKSESHRQEYQDYESRENQPIPARETKEESAARKLREFHAWDSRTHWQRKAALLPPPYMEHLDSWKDAALLYKMAIFANEVYSNPKGKLLKKATLERATQMSLLNFGMCKECHNPIDQAQCSICETTRTDIIERIRNAESRELELFESLEKEVKNSFATAQIGRALKDSFRVILGQRTPASEHVTKGSIENKSEI